MSHPDLTIGALAAQTLCTIPTIRYYEQIGLLPPAQRAANGHRYYRDADVNRLVFIKRCRDYGFSIEQIRQLLPLFGDQDRACVEARDLAQMHLDQLRASLAQMHQLEASLAAIVARCNDTCVAGSTRNCTMMEDLTTLDLASPSLSGSCCAPPA